MDFCRVGSPIFCTCESKTWLTLSTLWANSDSLMIFFVFFPQKIDFDIPCSLFPKEKID